MLRITAQEAPGRVLLKLEGRLTGVWVPELEASWRRERESHPAHPIWVDLCDVDVVDTAGRYLLTLMHDSGTQFVARGCAMSELIREVTAGRPMKT